MRRTAWFLLVLALAGCSGRPANILRWGGDSTGGEPYIHLKDGEQPSGFEGDLARYLAGKLGKTSEFVHNEWASLPQDLKRGDIDIVLNGYEWNAERSQAMAPSLPYYAYRLRLIVRKDSPIKNWSDLEEGKPFIGVLGESAAESFVRQRFPDAQVVPMGTEGTTGAMNMVVQKRLVATVQDEPVAVWYLQRRREFPQLHVVGEPVAPVPHSYYVLYLRPQDEVLRKKLNAALEEGLKDGSLKAIYDRYGLWNADQEQLLEVIQDWPPPETPRHPGWLGVALELLAAAGITVLLACLAMPLAVAIGLPVAVGRLYGPRWLATLLGVYVEVIRGTPVLLQLTVLYYYLPNMAYNLLGVQLMPPAFWTGVVGLGLNYGAYEAENYRGGLLAIPRGQMEAALALGMTRWTALWRILVPQAFRLVIPPVTNDFISLFKDTSICSVITIIELSKQSQRLNNDFPTLALEVALLTGALYLLMSYPLSLVARRLEQKHHPAH